MITYKKTIWCKLGLHDWYYGSFTQFPGDHAGRYERHCLECNKMQYKVYNGQGDHSWVTTTQKEKDLIWITHVIDRLQKKYDPEGVGYHPATKLLRIEKDMDALLNLIKEKCT